MTNRAIIYCRVSGDDRKKDGINLASQLEMGQEYCRNKDYTVVAELAEDDRGASGADFDLPELNKALEMARNGQVDVLVTRELDRFARGLAKQLIVEGEFERAGVDVKYVLAEYDDTPEGQLTKHVRAIIAEYERLKIAERSLRGRRNKVRAGHVMAHSNPPYGYQIAEVDGKSALVIYEPEARIVRLIFQWYTEGDGENGPLSVYAVAQRLTEARIPTRGDTDPTIKKESPYGKWSKATVASILGSETHAGVWHYGKNRTNEDGWTLNPRDSWIPVEVPAIVSRETWEKAQLRRKENRYYAERRTKYKYLLRRRVLCGKCGAAMHSVTTHSRGKPFSYYVCPARDARHDYARVCSQRTHFRSKQGDAVVWEYVQSYLENREKLWAGAKKHQAEQEKGLSPLRERLKMTDDLIASNQGQLERVLDLYLAGEFPKEILVERKSRLETTIAALEREQAILTAQLEARTITDEQIRDVERFMARAAECVAKAGGDFEAQRRVLEMMDARVTLTIEDGQMIADFCGIVGEKRLLIGSNSTRSHRHNSQTPGENGHLLIASTSSRG